MILKHKDDVAPQLAELERLMALPELTKAQRDAVEEELWAMRVGAKGEKEAAYHIDFGWKDGESSVVIHDLRLEHNGRVAQFDHMILHRTLHFHVMESKAFGREVRISDTGEWETSTKFGWRGTPSPVEQNRRHIDVLKSFIDAQALAPKRLGITLPIDYHNWVLVSPSCKIRREGAGWDRVVRMDLFEKRFTECHEKNVSGLGFISAVTRIVGLDTLENIAKTLVAAHRPASFDYAAKFGIKPKAAYELKEPVSVKVAEEPPSAAQPAKVCESCNAEVEQRVVNFCRMNAEKFGGKLLCQACQKPNAAAECDECKAELESKVVAFCRFNKKRFGGRKLCRECQASVGKMAECAPDGASA